MPLPKKKKKLNSKDTVLIAGLLQNKLCDTKDNCLLFNLKILV